MTNRLKTRCYLCAQEVKLARRIPGGDNKIELLDAAYEEIWDIDFGEGGADELEVTGHLPSRDQSQRGLWP